MTAETNVNHTSNSEFSSEDYAFMQHAISLAKKGHYTTSPNPRVGCVIVKDGVIVGEGYHQKAGEAHAEINALSMAAEKSQGATAYVTLEPCSHYGRTPPCAEALVKAKVSHVIAAMVDPNPQVAGKGLKILEEAGISTRSGLLTKEAQALNQGFITLMTTKKPFVRCKLASSLDGKTAMANGESKWITSSVSRQDVQRLRAQCCAVISGVDSVLFDNAKMNVRWSELGSLQAEYRESLLRQPSRVIIDPHNKLTPNLVDELALFAEKSPIILIHLHNDETKPQSDVWPGFVDIVSVKPATSGKINLNDVLIKLGEKGLNDVLIESGARLAGAFIEQNLVNELVLYQAPKLMGDSGKGLAVMPSVENLSSAKLLDVIDVRMVGNDIRTTATFTYK